MDNLDTHYMFFGVVIVAHLFCFLCYVFVVFIFALCLVSIVACLSKLSIHDYPHVMDNLDTQRGNHEWTI
jgi:hypothetical protein